MTSHVLLSSPFIQLSVAMKYIIDDLMNMIGTLLDSESNYTNTVGPFVRGSLGRLMPF